MKLDQFEKALEKLTDVIELDPNDELAQMHLATCYTKLGDGDRSLWHARKALQLSKRGRD